MTPKDGTNLKQREAGAMPSFRQLLVDVRAFRDKLELYDVPPHPTILSKEKASAYFWSFDEEAREFIYAIEGDNLIGAVDAMVDMAYLALGRIVEMGVDAEKAWLSVHRANMGKERGSVDKRPGLKGMDAVKPPGWTPPDYAWLKQRLDAAIVHDIGLSIPPPPTEAHLNATCAQDLRVVTGAQPADRIAQAYAQKRAKPPVAVIPLEAIEGMGRGFALGLEKYSMWQYMETPLTLIEYLSAAIRHCYRRAAGQVIDDDPHNVQQADHIDLAMCCLAMAKAVMAHHPEKDNSRPTKRSVEQ